jgi:hypothetical protein
MTSFPGQRFTGRELRPGDSFIVPGPSLGTSLPIQYFIVSVTFIGGAHSDRDCHVAYLETYCGGHARLRDCTFGQDEFFVSDVTRISK